MTPMEFIDKHLVSIDLTEIVDTKPPVDYVDCDAFSTLLGIHVDDGVHVNDHFCDALAYGTAIAISTPLPGDPLWGFVYGPPSSSKTVIIDDISTNRNFCVPMTTLTGLHSGYQTDKEGKEDNSIVPLINGRCVCIKDFTAILSLPVQAQERIFGELRDFYDGASHAHFRNKRKSRYENVRFSMLAGVTDVIHKFNRSDLGERFLKLDIIDPTSDHKQVTKTSMQTTFDMLRTKSTHGRTIKYARSRGATGGLIEYLTSDLEQNGLGITDERVRHEFQVYIDALATLVAYARSNVLWEKGDMLLAPRPEVNTRLSNQFLKLSTCLGFVLKESYDSNEVRRLIKRVAIDTGCGFKMDILNALGEAKAGLSCDEIAHKLHKPDKTIKNRLIDLYHLHAVKKFYRVNSGGHGGTKVEVWGLTPKLRSVWDKIKSLS